MSRYGLKTIQEALFDALQRREVYASTGPRITLRLFAGWGFTGEELDDADFAAQGYSAGVPMGGQLTGSCEQTGQVSILVKASRDRWGKPRQNPDSERLDGSGRTPRASVRCGPL
ncbi:MAG: hypothetical protein CM15mP74_32220 [Halieaceae bacterium]|nr:MAG: hypothetical protein CM15mP74_32220 [Halieaceae bacterium]